MASSNEARLQSSALVRAKLLDDKECSDSCDNCDSEYDSSDNCKLADRLPAHRSLEVQVVPGSRDSIFGRGLSILIVCHVRRVCISIVNGQYAVVVRRMCG